MSAPVTASVTASVSASASVTASVTASVAVAALVFAACAPADPPPTAPDARAYEPYPAFTSGNPIERFFPLVDGYVYSYATMTENGDTGVVVSTVIRPGPAQGELRSSAGVKRFAYMPEGVVSASTGAFMLKAPLVAGSSWPGEHGGVTRIDATDLAVNVIAGTFTGCLRTVEVRGGDVPARYITTFCPDVGIVALEVAGGMNLVRAELKSYAPPVRIGPDGLIKSQVPPGSP